MMAGSGGAPLSLADWPATFPCSAAPRSTSSTSGTAAVYIDAHLRRRRLCARDPRAPAAA